MWIVSYLIKAEIYGTLPEFVLSLKYLGSQNSHINKISFLRKKKKKSGGDILQRNSWITAISQSISHTCCLNLNVHRWKWGHLHFGSCSNREYLPSVIHQSLYMDENLQGTWKYFRSVSDKITYLQVSVFILFIHGSRCNYNGDFSTDGHGLNP